MYFTLEIKCNNYTVQTVNCKVLRSTACFECNSGFFFFSKFENIGEVRALGNRRNPQLILVDVDGRIKEFPDLSITDYYER